MREVRARLIPNSLFFVLETLPPVSQILAFCFFKYTARNNTKTEKRTH